MSWILSLRQLYMARSKQVVSSNLLFSRLLLWSDPSSWFFQKHNRPTTFRVTILQGVGMVEWCSCSWQYGWALMTTRQDQSLSSLAAARPWHLGIDWWESQHEIVWGQITSFIYNLNQSLIKSFCEIKKAKMEIWGIEPQTSSRSIAKEALYH